MRRIVCTSTPKKSTENVSMLLCTSTSFITTAAAATIHSYYQGKCMWNIRKVCTNMPPSNVCMYTKYMFVTNISLNNVCVLDWNLRYIKTCICMSLWVACEVYIHSSYSSIYLYKVFQSLREKLKLEYTLYSFVWVSKS